MEVLERRGFSRKWRELMEQVVTGGRVGINLNLNQESFLEHSKS
jgi:hypothetical protein